MDGPQEAEKWEIYSIEASVPRGTLAKNAKFSGMIWNVPRGTLNRFQLACAI